MVRRVRILIHGTAIFLWVSLSALACSFPALAQPGQAPAAPEAQKGPPAAPGTKASASQPTPNQQLTGSISGAVSDQSGTGVAGASVTLSRGDQSPIQQVLSGDDGQFSFAGIAPGPFQITIAIASFVPQSVSGILHPGETYTVPPIVLGLATVVTTVRVSPPRDEMAKYQLEVEEKQRVLGFIPNFYVTYIHDAAPLNPHQKFELAWKSTVDPITFVLTGAAAGIEQAHNSFSGYGQGAQGYAKRYGASYADLVLGTFIGSAVLPSLLKQDPRYFYKGTGSKRSRFLYAIANAVICKGDNGHWQADYSSILGNLAAAGISNLYYPAQNRNGVRLTFENTVIGIGTTAAANLIEEFVVPKLTPNFSHRHSAQP